VACVAAAFIMSGVPRAPPAASRRWIAAPPNVPLRPGPKESASTAVRLPGTPCAGASSELATRASLFVA